MDTNIKNILIVLVVLSGAAGILLVSMSRATLEVMAKDEREGRLRVEPVIIKDKTIYKLPQTNMLPDNIFYGVKETRDWLWQKFSFGNEKEAKTILILADKRMSEARSLSKMEKHDLAFETGMKAVDKLKYANELVMKMDKESTLQKQMMTQIKETTAAYEEIIKEIGQKAENGDKKYSLLQKNINDFKEKQIKKEQAER